MIAPGSIRGRAPWRDDEPLECVRVIPEAPDVATFVLRAPSGAWFDHRPGQFLTLEIPLQGGVTHRTYTISSPPSRPLCVSVTVKAQPDSQAGRWLLDNLRPGMRLRAKGPAGAFTLDAARRDRLLMIAAGSGVTPMMAMAAQLWDAGEDPDIVLILTARRPEDLIFRPVFEHMAARAPGLKLHFAVSDPDEAWSGYRGRLTPAMLDLMVPDLTERAIFCCGPEGFMRAARDMAALRGFDMAHWHEESFGAPSTPPPVEAADVGGSEIAFAQSGVVAPCAEDQTVLAAARAAGLNIPSGCTIGLCGTCRVLKTEGAVAMAHQGGLSEEDEAEGWILACCARPQGRIVVDL
jgi:ferredoxin-NADP reductase